jgi:hypothetical protein
MKPTMLPTKGDFDRAVKQPWSSTTCLVAQLMIRQGIKPMLNSGKMRNNPFWVAEDNGLRPLQMRFDAAYQTVSRAKASQPSFWPKTVAEAMAELGLIRKALPRFNWPWLKLRLPQ